MTVLSERKRKSTRTFLSDTEKYQRYIDGRYEGKNVMILQGVTLEPGASFDEYGRIVYIDPENPDKPEISDRPWSDDFHSKDTVAIYMGAVNMSKIKRPRMSIA